jgi:hypothetical protein
MEVEGCGSFRAIQMNVFFYISNKKYLYAIKGRKYVLKLMHMIMQLNSVLSTGIENVDLK